MTNIIAAITLAVCLFSSAAFVTHIVGDAIRNAATGGGTPNRAFELGIVCVLWAAYFHLLP
jgi:hypothetical protein